MNRNTGGPIRGNLAKPSVIAALPIGLAMLNLNCQGQPSTQPPRRVVGDMARQPKALPFTALAQLGRTPIGAGVMTGVVAEEQASERDPFYTGLSPGGPLSRVPFTVDAAVLTRGEERFNAYCSPCHDKAGTARGVVARRGFPSPIELSSEPTRARSDGELFGIITHGVRNMPGLAEIVEPGDRWRIVVWLRVLQRSQHASPADVTSTELASILPEQATP